MTNRTESDAIIDRINKEFRDENEEKKKIQYQAIDRIRKHQKKLIHEQRIETEKIVVAELKLKKEQQILKEIEKLDVWRPSI